MTLQKFHYRSPRFSIDLPLQIKIADATVAARGRKISHEGMMVEFQEPIERNSSGFITLSHRDQSIEVQVRVARTDGKMGGLVFVFDSDVQKTDVARLVASMIARQSGHRPVLLR